MTIIISASRRTDIPAFYTQWFVNRIRKGYCTVFNPFNRRQVSRVSLLPQDVDVIVFWTKNPRPLMEHIVELDARGFKYYFQYTVNGYPPQLEPNIPQLKTSIETFSELASMIGAEKVIWRYDPVLISNITDYNYHLKRFTQIAALLKGKTKRVVISLVDEYRKATYKFKKLKGQNINVIPSNELNYFKIGELMKAFSELARDNGMEIYSCAETVDLEPYNILPGKCVDDQYIRRVFGLAITNIKDKSQRSECGCIPSKDIGIYDTCLYDCAYCYAGTIKSGQKQRHDIDSPSLIDRYETSP